MTPLPEQVLENAEVSETPLHGSMASLSVCCCNELPDLELHALDLRNSFDMLRSAKMNVISLVPQVFLPWVYGPHFSGAILSSACAARRSCDSFFVGLLRPSTDTCGRTSLAGLSYFISAARSAC